MAGRPKGLPKTGGRARGAQNKSTRAFKDIMDAVLFDNSEETVDALLALRDSDEAADRATFWRLASKLLPQAIQVEPADDVLVVLKFAGGRYGDQEGLHEIRGDLRGIEGGRDRDDRPAQ